MRTKALISFSVTCFRIGKNLVFSRRGLVITDVPFAFALKSYEKISVHMTYSVGYGGSGKSTDMHSYAANVTAAI